MALGVAWLGAARLLGSSTATPGCRPTRRRPADSRKPHSVTERHPGRLPAKPGLATPDGTPTPGTDHDPGRRCAAMTRSAARLSTPSARGRGHTSPPSGSTRRSPSPGRRYYRRWTPSGPALSGLPAAAARTAGVRNLRPDAVRNVKSSIERTRDLGRALDRDLTTVCDVKSRTEIEPVAGKTNSTRHTFPGSNSRILAHVLHAAGRRRDVSRSGPPRLASPAGGAAPTAALPNQRRRRTGVAQRARYERVKPSPVGA